MKTFRPFIFVPIEWNMWICLLSERDNSRCLRYQWLEMGVIHLNGEGIHEENIPVLLFVSASINIFLELIFSPTVPF